MSNKGYCKMRKIGKSSHCTLYVQPSVWPAWACPKYPGLAAFLLPPILTVLQAICLQQTVSSLPIDAAVAFPPVPWIKLTDYFISIEWWRCGATDGREEKICRTFLLNIFYQVVCSPPGNSNQQSSMIAERMPFQNTPTAWTLCREIKRYGHH